MADYNNDLTQQVMATANRLRQIQADFADGSAQTREEYLSDEVERVLATLVPDNRPSFLKALQEQFPTWDANMVVQDQPAASMPTQSPTDEREWGDVSFVLERLLELAADQSDDQRQKIIDRLKAAGLSQTGQWGVPQKLVDELKSDLGLDAEQDVDPGRVVELAIRLISFSHKLDQLGWQIWRTIAPKSSLRSASTLQSTMVKFTQGESDVPLTNDLERLRHLIASLLSAISQVGRQFGQSHLAKFAPNEIETSAMTEGGGFLVAKEVKCWRKYVELAKSMDDAAAIDSQVMRIIADFVESMPGQKR